MSRARRQTRLVVHAAETALASAQTIDARLRRMGVAGAVTDPENLVMVTEKIAAAQESAFASAPAIAKLGSGLMGLWMRQATLGMALTGSLMSARTPAAAVSAWMTWANGSSRALAPSMASLVEASSQAIRPYRSRSRANARRLASRTS